MADPAAPDVELLFGPGFLRPSPEALESMRRQYTRLVQQRLNARLPRSTREAAGRGLRELQRQMSAVGITVRSINSAPPLAPGPFVESPVRNAPVGDETYGSTTKASVMNRLDSGDRGALTLAPPPRVQESPLSPGAAPAPAQAAGPSSVLDPASLQMVPNEEIPSRSLLESAAARLPTTDFPPTGADALPPAAPPETPAAAAPAAPAAPAPAAGDSADINDPFIATRGSRYGLGGIYSALEDPNQLREDDQTNDLIERLTDGILNPRRNSDVHVPFSPGEMLAMGILGGLDKDAFNSVVMPLLAGEQQRQERESDKGEARAAREQAALGSLIQLRQQQDDRRQQRLEFAAMERHRLAQEAATLRGQDISLFNSQAQIAAANARAEANRQSRIDLFNARLAVMPDSTRNGIISLKDALREVNEAQQILTAHPLLAGYGAGIVPKFLPAEISAAKARLDTIYGDLNLIYTKPRVGGAITEGELGLVAADLLRLGKSANETNAALNAISIRTQNALSAWRQRYGALPGDPIPLADDGSDSVVPPPPGLVEAGTEMETY